MEGNFNLEIISPEKIIFSNKAQMVKIPSYEGDMSVLKDHISIISFLRPGLIKVEISDGNFEEFFTQDGIVEFFNNNLVLLSSSVENIKNLPRDFFDRLSKETQDKVDKEDISDQERYLLNHKLDAIKEINI
jgi:F-type H+-transporting ATPase subunit epsilon